MTTVNDASTSTTKPVHSITFAVHDVVPADKKLQVVKLPVAIKYLLDRAGTSIVRRDVRLESCCDYSTDAVKRIETHPLIAATHLAYSEHRPLVLSPDMLWLAVLQGIAQHVHVDPEASRSLFVSHQGRMPLQTEVEPLIVGSPENAWPDIVAQFSKRLNQELGSRYERFECEFTTTGPLERIACQIAVMDMLEPFFEYIMVGICGIPAITLEGTPDDWSLFKSRLSVLNEVGMSWWYDALAPIATEFAQAAKGIVNVEFWRNVHKQEEAYGATNINGWMVKFVPYVEGAMGIYNVRNPMLDDANQSEYLPTKVLPSGISAVPIHYDIIDGQGRRMDETYEVLGGFLGVTQDPETLALRPKLGWAVRRGGAEHRLYRELAKYKPEPPLGINEFNEALSNLEHPRVSAQKLNLSLLEITRGVRPPLKKFFDNTLFPGELRQFYRWCNGVTAFSDKNSVRFHSLQHCDGTEDVRILGEDDVAARDNMVKRCGWIRFCTFSDKTFALITKEYVYRPGPGHSNDRSVEHWVVLGGRGAEVNGQLPIVARSFHEFLRLLLNAEGDIRKLRRCSLSEILELGPDDKIDGTN